MSSKHSFSTIVTFIRELAGELSDCRTGSNTRYSMEDITLSAFSVFFNQYRSFLEGQRSMRERCGRDNARTIFQIEKIPTDNHIRKVLDGVHPEEINPAFDLVYEALEDTGKLAPFKGINNTTLIALDGIQFHSSENIGCDNCSYSEYKNGDKIFKHNAVVAAVVSPDIKKAIALRPEFTAPQDGHNKQDCEIAAAKRWIEKNGPFYNKDGNVTLLGDDLYAHQPFIRKLLLYNFHYIFTCKPGSHKYLSEWLNDLEEGKNIHVFEKRVKNEKNKWETHTYRYANGVPLTHEEGALKVNWCEVTITNDDGKVSYKNSFITDFEITNENVSDIVKSGRTRWKIENEHNNTLKTKGYHLEHNYGHGKKHLSSLLAAMNILAFLLHTLLDFCNGKYKQLRNKLVTRKAFFNTIEALMKLFCFSSLDELIDFILAGLEKRHDIRDLKAYRSILP